MILIIYLRVYFYYHNFVEALADEKVEVIKPAPVAVTNVNKWDGEDEDDVKVSWCNKPAHRLHIRCEHNLFNMNIVCQMFRIAGKMKRKKPRRSNKSMRRQSLKRPNHKSLCSRN